MHTNEEEQKNVTLLIEALKLDRKHITYNDKGLLVSLDLSNKGLTQFPIEVLQLTNLQELILNNNRLTQLPAQIGQIINLQKLYLWDNQLSQVPAEIGQLTHLQELILSYNQLSQIPVEIGQLSHLQKLILNNNQLSYVPAEVGLLSNLQELILNNNQLSHVPAEIGQLTHLQKLYLWGNQLSQVPAEIGQLTHLEELSLSYNQLSQVPIEIGRLSHLQKLFLNNNQLSQIPVEISLLSNLCELILNNNQLSQIPVEIGRLTHLQKLILNNNQLSHVPAEIGLLFDLQELYLNDNQLSHVPAEIGQLHLQKLALTSNPPLLTPPPEVLSRGTLDILSFLQELQKSSTIRYESKLLVVGEGNTGKTSLLRSLRGENFESNFLTTHGIQVNQLSLPYDSHQLTLHTWDFGGQEIYRTTHQFFLTKRSLYILVWNARAEAMQAELDHWLETIKTLAPQAPILLVATHIEDGRSPDLNYQRYTQSYPQIVGQFAISNRDRIGIEELRQALAKQAWDLPFMGQRWPQKWIDVELSLAARSEQHIDIGTYIRFCSQQGVDEEIAKGSLGNYLHDLGKILYFYDDDLLSNLVILQPKWVTQAIARVLDNEDLKNAGGILQHENLSHIWTQDDQGRPFERHLYPFLFRIMERFELSYQIEADVPGEETKQSLIPLLLPYQPPLPLPAWTGTPPMGQLQVEMVYRLDFVPAGVMSRFIVRTHRYTRGLHWREGVLLEYQKNQARIELDSIRKEIRILVQGPLPQNFFTILMNTLDVILNRFEKLNIRREIPCICHQKSGSTEPCSQSYLYEDLIFRMEKGKFEVECLKTLSLVSVTTLLYGIHKSTNELVMEDIQEGLKELNQRDRISQSKLDKIDQRTELIRRDIIRQWNWEMIKFEAACPNTFILESGSQSIFNPKNWVSQEYKLFLVCQHPSQPHPVEKSYPLRQADEWWIAVSPWLNHLITFLKIGIPVGGKILDAVVSEADIKKLQNGLDLIKQLASSLSEFPSLDSMDRQTTVPTLHKEQQPMGPAFRALYSYLDEADKSHIWGRLSMTRTPDDQFLWLCEKHKQQFQSKPLPVPTSTN